MSIVGTLLNKEPDPRSVVQSNILPSSNLFGVEVELEDVPGVIGSPLKYWTVKEDGSLRNNGAEFVFKAPLGGMDIIKALTELDSFIRANGLNPSLTDRTSVHVHMDVRHLETTQLKNLIILYTIFERVLFKFAGPHRFHNIFCLPIENAQGLIRYLNKLCNSGNAREFKQIIRGVEKYSAFNIRSLENYGSVEFRMHKGEWKARPLIRWIQILSCLSQAAIDNIDISSIHASISGEGPIRYLTSVFGKLSHLLIYDTVDIDIMEGVRLSQDILNFHTMITSDGGTRHKSDGDLLSKFIDKHGVVKEEFTIADIMGAYRVGEVTASKLLEQGLQERHIEVIRAWKKRNQPILEEFVGGNNFFVNFDPEEPDEEDD